MLDAHQPDVVLRNAVAAAVMAPSTHNTQPWRFRIAGTRLDLFADGARHLPVIDAEGRQQLLSLGCALYNARVAIRAMGYAEVVTDVIYEPGEEPGYVASICLGGHRITTETDHLLMQALPLRRTNRRGFLPRPVPPPYLDALADAAVAEGATLARLDTDAKRALAELVEAADELQLGDPAFRAELSHWLVPFGSRRRDGIPFVEKEYGSPYPFTLMRTLRSPTLGESFGSIEQALVEGAPLVVVLGTPADDRASWLACGQALEAVLLHATAHRLSAAFLNQALEIPDLRARVAELAPAVGYPQMVLRLGIPVEPIHHVAPRRELADVLEG